MFYEESGEKHVTPLLSSRKEVAPVADICSTIGVKVSTDALGELQLTSSLLVACSSFTPWSCRVWIGRCEFSQDNSHSP